MLGLSPHLYKSCRAQNLLSGEQAQANFDALINAGSNAWSVAGALIILQGENLLRGVQPQPRLDATISARAKAPFVARDITNLSTKVKTATRSQRFFQKRSALNNALNPPIFSKSIKENNGRKLIAEA